MYLVEQYALVFFLTVAQITKLFPVLLPLVVPNGKGTTYFYFKISTKA